MKETAGRQQKRDFGWIFFACGVKENRRMVVAAKKGLWVSQLESVSLSECTGGSRFIRTNRTEWKKCGLNVEFSILKQSGGCVVLRTLQKHFRPTLISNKACSDKVWSTCGLHHLQPVDLHNWQLPCPASENGPNYKHHGVYWVGGGCPGPMKWQREVSLKHRALSLTHWHIAAAHSHRFLSFWLKHLDVKIFLKFKSLKEKSFKKEPHGKHLDWTFKVLRTRTAKPARKKHVVPNLVGE